MVGCLLASLCFVRCFTFVRSFQFGMNQRLTYVHCARLYEFSAAINASLLACLLYAVHVNVCVCIHNLSLFCCWYSVFVIIAVAIFVVGFVLIRVSIFMFFFSLFLFIIRRCGNKHCVHSSFLFACLHIIFSCSGYSSTELNWIAYKNYIYSHWLSWLFGWSTDCVNRKSFTNLLGENSCCCAVLFCWVALLFCMYKLYKVKSQPSECHRLLALADMEAAMATSNVVRRHK